MTIFDSSDIGSFVAKNNRKYANHIIRHIIFYNKYFCLPILTLPLKKNLIHLIKTSVHDSKLSILTLKDFFLSIHLINPKTFLDDTASLHPRLYSQMHPHYNDTRITLRPSVHTQSLLSLSPAYYYP